ncbi:hypothetical protein, partial [Methanocella sp.]|uniref:hypothetical protein n=1 Tax=Methanocella sp. TaxID=2052833 RepID=UPI002D7E7490
MYVEALNKEKTWIPILLGLDFLLYGLFDTYTKLARFQHHGLGYFLDFPAIVQQFWNAHSNILDADMWTMGHAQNALNLISAFYTSNSETIIFYGFIICTFVLIVAMTRYYPAFISVSYGVFAGVALIGL